MPTLLVRRGELVEMTLVNRSYEHHPMHLHGQHVLVLSRDGRAVRGSPWWPDTLQRAQQPDRRPIRRLSRPH